MERNTVNKDLCKQIKANNEFALKFIWKEIELLKNRSVLKRKTWSYYEELSLIKLVERHIHRHIGA
ncbi:HNH endonuclease [Streptococcus sp. SK643]|uniref:HNH endonuclease n=1 Tax=Streptococcus sp. SK643 TaxID=1095727 RepID=UPI003FA43CCD